RRNQGFESSSGWWLGRSFLDVGVAEGAGPDVVSVDDSVFPAATVDEDVVVAALWGAVFASGGAVWRDGWGGVEVAVSWGKPASGEAAGLAGGFDESFVGGAEPASDQAGVYDVAVFVDVGVLPVGVGVVFA